MDIKNNKLIDTLLLFIFLYFCISYILKLNYSFFNKDEIIYLSDSLLLLEGLRPAHSHSPSGISTWFGSLIVLIDFLINEFSFKSIEAILLGFDLTLYKHYQDLTFIKSSLYFLNIILLLFLFYLDEKRIFFLIFLILFLFPKSYEITFSATPYFIGSILCGISFLLKDKNKFLSLIIFGLALSERIEFLILINFLCFEDKKFNIKNFITIIITFLVISPWFSVALSHNIKTWLTIFVHMTVDNGKSNLFILSKIFLILFVLTIFSYSLILNKKIKFIYIGILIFTLLFFSFTPFVQVRWLVPGFVLLGYELSLLIDKKIYLFKMFMGLFLILLITYFNNKNFVSDNDILNLENNSTYTNIISDKLLKENLNFKNYEAIFGGHIRQKNVKNINFFNKKNAPLSFGRSGNFELSYHRRYDFLIKYSPDNQNNKYIQGASGLHFNAKEWCTILNKQDSAIIFDNSLSMKSCNDIN